MKFSITNLALILICLAATSCQIWSPDKEDEKESEIPSVSVTQWTEKMELFMEYPVPVESESGKFIIHLTTLDDFEPVREGKVILDFRHDNGEEFKFEKDAVLREGIFTPTASLPISGTYIFTLHYKGKKAEETFDIGKITAYKSYKDIPEQPDEDTSGISFLKEQQWKTEFQTRPAEIKQIRSSISAVGEIHPRQQSFAEITSPVDGIIDIKHNQNMVTPGSKVSKGEVVAVLSPPLNTVDSWTELKLAYQEAKSEYERAERLMEKDAISKREYEKLKLNYLTRKAGYEEFFNSQLDNGNEHFELKSPISGIVNEVSALPGQKAEAGQKIMTVIDPSTVWLKVNVFEKDYHKIGTPEGASLTIPGLDSPVVLDKDNFRLLSTGNIIETESRTIPVLLEVKNPDGLFKIGQVPKVELYTSEQKQALCAPSQAIYDDDGKQVLFVHTEGETFEKRVIETGDSYNGCVAILKGLQEGERVVSKGGYQVKLASTSAAIGHPHAH